MRVSACLGCVVVAAGLLLMGCGKVDNTPPPGARTDTPVLDIDEGTEVSPEELQTKSAADPPAPPAKS
jgi:hypothetical protein